ncbi:ABC transporter substrate-binding protein [Gordonia rubripertincta]|uniref:ABC transporter substrate-binding protein n=1 Tax=Gordonia rubripertincta TaxID=36822 RepID=UPI000B8D23FC|nr:ABC transporter substrate-binding protein [Gordonia rubripertincta]ASR01706.1 NMT1/THI5 like protein [Gordonia rubripertincta]
MLNSTTGRFGRLGRIVALGAAVSMAAVVLAACGGQDRDPNAASTADGNHSDPANPVYFNWSENPKAPSLVKIADELGLWKDTGVKPKYLGNIDAAQVPALLGTGEVTFASFMFNRALAAVAAGVDLKVIASQTYTTEDEPHMEYFVRSDSTLNPTTLKQLEGKTVGLASLKGCAEFILKDYLVKNDVDVSTIKFLTQSESLLPQSLEQGDVDLAVIHPPTNGVLRTDKDLKVAFSDYDNSASAGGLAPINASGKFIRKYPAQTREFVGTLVKTANWINANPEETRDIVARVTGLPKEQITKYYYTNNLILDKEQTGFWWGLADRVGTLTPEEAKLTPEDIATNEFNPYANGPALIGSQSENTKVLTDTEF